MRLAVYHGPSSNIPSEAGGRPTMRITAAVIGELNALDPTVNNALSTVVLVGRAEAGGLVNACLTTPTTPDAPPPTG